VLCFTREGLAAMADDVRRLARHEGLTAHAASVDVRLAETNNAPPRTDWPSKQSLE
jgi:histidinol dehydrogenase